MEPDSNKIILITAPSGSGKTTIVKKILELNSNLEFSVSATTRAIRGNEKDGVDYYFISLQDFEEKIKSNAFAEYEMVYTNKYYGTLKEKLNDIWARQHFPLADIDVKGAIKLKNYFGKNALSIFIKPPSIEELRKRLEKRNTDLPEAIDERIKKAKEELTFENKFDLVVINDVLQNAIEKVHLSINNFLKIN
ncbi:MAG: guanylate kinase [Chitinophagaceae bacterium]|nr:guanylate kinase [Chitinophagaceae bacterium]